VSLLLFLGAGGSAPTSFTGTGDIRIDAPQIAAIGLVTGIELPASGARVTGPAKKPHILMRGGIIIDAPAISGRGVMWENEDYLFGLFPSDDELVN
jgi:hypothetical protein